MNEYLKELTYYLKHLDNDALNDTIDYYRDYLEDGNFVNYNDCVKELGTPRSLSRQILADYSLNHDDNSKKRGKNSQTIWLIILAILASPVALTISIPVVAVLFALGIAIIAFLFAILLVIIFSVITVIIMIPIGITILFTHFAMGLALLGLTLLGIGFSGALIIGLIWLTPKLINGLKQLSTTLYLKITKRNHHKKGDQ